jgi:hypothetical protein
MVHLLVGGLYPARQKATGLPARIMAGLSAGFVAGSAEEGGSAERLRVGLYSVSTPSYDFR